MRYLTFSQNTSKIEFWVQQFQLYGKISIKIFFWIFFNFRLSCNSIQLLYNNSEKFFFRCIHGVIGVTVPSAEFLTGAGFLTPLVSTASCSQNISTLIEKKSQSRNPAAIQSSDYFRSMMQQFIGGLMLMSWFAAHTACFSPPVLNDLIRLLVDWSYWSSHGKSYLSRDLILRSLLDGLIIFLLEKSEVPICNLFLLVKRK